MSTAFTLQSMSTVGKYNHYSGLDTSVTPPWQMVPVKDDRFLLAYGPDIGRISSTVPAVAEAAVVPSHFREQLVCVRGKTLGKSQIVFHDTRDKPLGRLDVRVFPEIRRVVKFFLVSDAAGHATITKPLDVRKWVDTTNRNYLGPQANVYFDVKLVDDVKVPRNLGKIVHFDNFTISVPRTATHKNWHDITKRGDLDPKVFNVFCVWDFIGGDTTEWDGFVAAKNRVDATKMKVSGANVNMCIIKDHTSTGSDGVFAHEAVHYLSRLIGVDHTNKDHRLMRGEEQTVPGRFLSKPEIEKIHEWAAKI